MRAANCIAYDARYVNDRYHGIGRYAFRLLENLVTLAPDRKFVVFRGQAGDSRFDWSGLKKHPHIEFRNGPWPLYWPHEQFAWPLFLRKSHIDVFFSPSFPAPLWIDVPTIITVHDLIFDRYPAYMPARWAYPYYRLMMKFSSRRARAIVAVSKATAVDLMHYHPVASDKVSVIPEGVDPNFTHSQDESFLQSLQERYDLAERFILAVGVRRPHKNFARLVNAFTSLGPDYPAQLVFIGPSDDRFQDEARQAARNNGTNGRVRFLDWVPEADLPGLYSLATVVALPSLVEGFGLPALEAMACGAPVLVSNSSSLPELVGPAGFLVEPEDTQAIASSLRRMLRDDQLRSWLMTAGRERAALFTWESTACRVLNLFDQVVH